MNREIFVVIVEDRHFDVDVLAFASLESAVDEAKATVNRLAKHRPNDADWDYPLNASMVDDGWRFYVPYGHEGDSVRVIRRELSD